MFEVLLRSFLELILKIFLLHAILEMPDSSSKGLNSVKKGLLFQKHDALKSLSEPLLNEFLELNVSNLFVQTILEMSDSSSEGLISVKK